jgi:hypothetical protein
MAEITTNAQPTQGRSRFSAMGVGAAAYTTNPGDLGISADESAYGAYHLTRIKRSAVRQTISNGGTEYTNTLLYTFPVGIISFGLATFSLAPTHTSVIATSFNGATGAIGLGTAIASNATLATTMINVAPGTGQTPTAYTQSAAINVAQTAITGYTLALGTAAFDGTATAIKLYLNTSIAVGSVDGTVLWNGYVNLAWQFGGDY